METAVANLKANYLGVAQAPDTSAVTYPYHFIGPVNTGRAVRPRPQQRRGHRRSRGRLRASASSRASSVHRALEGIRSTSPRRGPFQQFLWKDMPGALLPPDPDDTDGDLDLTSYYNAARAERLPTLVEEPLGRADRRPGRRHRSTCSRAIRRRPSSTTARRRSIRARPWPTGTACETTTRSVSGPTTSTRRTAATSTTTTSGRRRASRRRRRGRRPRSGLALRDRRRPERGSRRRGRDLQPHRPAALEPAGPGHAGSDQRGRPRAGARLVHEPAEQDGELQPAGRLRPPRATPDWSITNAFVFWPETTDLEAGLLAASDHRSVVVDLDAVPEPATGIALGAGTAFLAWAAGRRRQRSGEGDASRSEGFSIDS
jgi:hypothetical protein